MPEPKNEDRPGSDLVTQLVITDDEPPDLARFVCCQFLADPRVLKQAGGCPGELLYDVCRSGGRDGGQLLV